jgi:ACDE family multidrug resistance protein
VASASYSFVRFSGRAIAPWLAGRLGEHDVHLPFWVGAGAVLGSVAVLYAGRRLLSHIDDEEVTRAWREDAQEEAELVTIADS